MRASPNLRMVRVAVRLKTHVRPLRVRRRPLDRGRSARSLLRNAVTDAIGDREARQRFCLAEFSRGFGECGSGTSQIAGAPVACLVSFTRLHSSRLEAWHKLLPDAKLWAPPRTLERSPNRHRRPARERTPKPGRAILINSYSKAMS